MLHFHDAKLFNGSVEIILPILHAVHVIAPMYVLNSVGSAHRKHVQSKHLNFRKCSRRSMVL